MRKVSECRVVGFHESGSSHEFSERIERLMADGFVPYGKPYYHGQHMFRDFVKFETVVDDPEEFEEEVGTDPWEQHDFFSEVE